MTRHDLDGSSDINQGAGSNEDFLAGFNEWFSDRLQLTETKKKLDAKGVTGKATALAQRRCQ